MYPELFRVGTIAIHSYAFMAAVAFAVVAMLAYRRCLLEGLNAERGFWLAPLTLAAAFIGARVLYVMVNYRRTPGRASLG